MVFGLGLGICCGAAAAAGRGISRGLGTALAALELAILMLAIVHGVGLVRADDPVEAKQVAYLLAGVFLLPCLLVGTGVPGRSRALAAGVGCLATAVMALRIEVVS